MANRRPQVLVYPPPYQNDPYLVDRLTFVKYPKFVELLLPLP